MPKVLEKSLNQKIIRIQKKIFQALEVERDLVLGEMPVSIQTYEKECHRDFVVRNKKSLPIVGKDELIRSVQNSDVTFIADFHTFDQAQRTALRILRDSVQPGNRANFRWVLGLEMIPSHFQNELDRFQAGKISVEQFHKAVSYANEWGFPWQNYSPLFDWARTNGVRVIALNRPKGFLPRNEDRDLLERDQWAAGVITDLFSTKATDDLPLKVIVLYGEHHVGTKHLPAQLDLLSRENLESKLKWVVIHQNHEPLYWKLMEQESRAQSPIVQLQPNVFCVFSSTPWAKIQSLLNWAENETPDPADQEVDYLFLMKSYGNTLAEFFSISPPSYESITIRTVEEASFYEEDYIQSQCSRDEIRQIQEHVKSNRTLYLPRLGIVYLGSPSHHRAAEMAAMHLLHQFKKETQPGLIETFYGYLLESMFAFFCTLILNPHRKCDMPSDHVQRLKSLHAGEKPSFPFEAESRLLAVTLLGNRSKVQLEYLMSDKKLESATLMGARFAGRILGRKLYQALIDEKVKIEQIRKYFLYNDSETPTSAYSLYCVIFDRIFAVPAADKSESL